MTHSEAINEIASALSVAQGQFKPVMKTKTAKVRTKTGYEYTYNYADLSDVIDATREPLSKNGIAITQDIGRSQNLLIVNTLLLHKSGQYLQYAIEVPTGEFGNSAVQAIGGTITYARRYALSAILNIASEDDDDANSVADDKPATKQAQKPEQKPAPKQETEEAKPQPSVHYLEHRTQVTLAISEIVGAKDDPKAWTKDEKEALEIAKLFEQSKKTEDINLLNVALLRVRIGQKTRGTNEWASSVKAILDVGASTDALEKILSSMAGELVTALELY